MRNVSDKLQKENQKAHFIWSNLFLFQNKGGFNNRVTDEVMWKNITAGQVTEDSMKHAHCMLDT